MYQKIVVPLDGSKFAECVLPHVKVIAEACNTKEVMLISVTERVSVHWDVPDSHQPLGKRLLAGTMGKLEKQAQRYLQRIARGLKTKGLQVRIEVLIGNPAEEIINYAERNDSDLIVMASHGRSY